MMHNTNYYVSFPPYEELDRVFIKNAILGMAPLSAMFLQVEGNQEVGVYIVRIDDDVFLVKEEYYNSSDAWRFLEGHRPVDEIFGHFEYVYNMHTSDSKEDE